MAWFRTKQRLIPWLVGLFVVVQFSGALPRLPYEQPGVIAATPHAAHQHMHAYADHDKSQKHNDVDHGPDIADQCCSLHLLTGVVPFVVTAISIEPLRERLIDVSKVDVGGVIPHRLDRPPRTLPS